MNHNTTSITIHNMEPLLYETLREQARTANLSLNKLIKSLLTQSLGLTKSEKVADFSQFLNQWSQADYDEFMQSQTDFSTVNPADWK